MKEAFEVNQIAVHNYIEGIYADTVISSYCPEFNDGLLSYGMLQLIGTFRKKFSDLHILLNDQSLTYNESVTSFLGGTRFKHNSTQSLKDALPLFMQVQELYLGRIIQRIDELMQGAYEKFLEEYMGIAELIFGIFLLIQIISLVYLRRKLVQSLKGNIVESRGILNLIPNHFFQDHKAVVEGLMKRIKE